MSQLYYTFFSHKFIEDFYFFEVNTKYISSSAVNKISIFHECVARVKMLIFSPHEMKCIWYLPKKSNFLFILYSTEIQKSQPYFLLGRFLFDLTFAVCLLGITLGVNIQSNLLLRPPLLSVTLP